MTTNRLFTSNYLQFLREIHAVGGVPCEDYPKFFFPEDLPSPEARQVATKIAKELCNGCPIKAKCFTYAIKTNQRHGIWAGTLPSER